MSYCRWGSDSDVYVYVAEDGGWVTHVAAKHRKIPPIPDIIGSPLSMWLHRLSGARWNHAKKAMEWPSAFSLRWYLAWTRVQMWWHKQIHMRSLRMIPLRPIGLPYDGESFSDHAPGRCADRLLHLRSLGYRVPTQAVKALREEQCASKP